MAAPGSRVPLTVLLRRIGRSVGLDALWIPRFLAESIAGDFLVITIVLIIRADSRKNAEAVEINA